MGDANNTLKIITVSNIHTHERADLCPGHYKSGARGDVQVQHGLHYSEFGCDVCRKRVADLTDK